MAACLPRDVVACGVGVGVSMIWMSSGSVVSFRASVILLVLLLRMDGGGDGNGSDVIRRERRLLTP